ncbi:hypothetical protein ACE6H2_016104 [Prunus campanulata]
MSGKEPLTTAKRRKETKTATSSPTKSTNKATIKPKKTTNTKVKSKTPKPRSKRLDDPNYVQIKSNMLTFQTTLSNIKDRLNANKQALRHLAKTPFWNLISAYREGYLTNTNCKKSNYDILRLINTYNPLKPKNSTLELAMSMQLEAKLWLTSLGCRTMASSCQTQQHQLDRNWIL